MVDVWQGAKYTSELETYKFHPQIKIHKILKLKYCVYKRNEKNVWANTKQFLTKNFHFMIW